MGRPRLSLLERCCRAKAFRPHQHWALLASEPDLPLPVLAELQRKARGASEEQQRELARELKRRLSELSAAERTQLYAAGVDAEDPGGADAEQCQASADTEDLADPEEKARGSLTVLVEAVLAELLAEVNCELTASEVIEWELLMCRVKRLEAIDLEIRRDGLTVAGSRGQRREHPLLPHEIELSSVLAEELREFASRLRRRAHWASMPEDLRARFEASHS